MAEGFGIELLAEDGAARRGRIATPHGSIETPTFMPVATFGAVRGISAEELRAAGAQILLSNTYHLHERPGEETVEALGGLHGFTGWDGPWLTDSGGFQVFSLGAARRHGVGKIASVFPENADRGGHLRVELVLGHVLR